MTRPEVHHIGLALNGILERIMMDFAIMQKGEPMRLIDADEYEKRIKPYDTEDAMDKALYNFAHGKLIETSTAQPRKGNWIGIDDEPCEVWECDKCGHIVECDATLALPNYCENCGADMREESK